MQKMLLLSMCIVIGASTNVQGGEWVDLFDGKTLDGWTVHSGYARYEVVDGVIVGSAAEGSPNSFLCHEKTFSDFILEFDVKLDSPLNSGVQFRSQIADQELSFIDRDENGALVTTCTIQKDRVYGYQVEAGWASSGNCGNIYDEARRNYMLDDFSKRPEASAAYKVDEWNKYRVECRGDHIRTWINGVPCTDIHDALRTSGIIGLQVHSVKRDYHPWKARFRNIRIQELP